MGFWVAIKTSESPLKIIMICDGGVDVMFGERNNFQICFLRPKKGKSSTSALTRNNESIRKTQLKFNILHFFLSLIQSPPRRQCRDSNVTRNCAMQTLSGGSRFPCSSNIWNSLCSAVLSSSHHRSDRGGT